MMGACLSSARLPCPLVTHVLSSIVLFFLSSLCFLPPFALSFFSLSFPPSSGPVFWRPVSFFSCFVFSDPAPLLAGSLVLFPTFLSPPCCVFLTLFRNFSWCGLCCTRCVCVRARASFCLLVCCCIVVWGCVIPSPSPHPASKWDLRVLVSFFPPRSLPRHHLFWEPCESSFLHSPSPPPPSLTHCFSRRAGFSGRGWGRGWRLWDPSLPEPRAAKGAKPTRTRAATTRVG